MKPRSILVVGASNDISKFSGKISLNVAQSDVERRYFVTSGAEEVQGCRTYRSISDVPEGPDAAMLIVPADAIPDVLEKCADIGVRSAVILAAGFGEAGEEGARREARLKEIAAARGMAVLGPNCIGLANYADRIFLTPIDAAAEAGAPGRTALIAQSGSLGIVLSSRPDGRFRHVITTGNETILAATDFLSWLMADPEIDTFGLVMEAVRDRHGLAQAAAAAKALGKRIVLLKLAGGKASGAIAALHTGSLSGDIAPLQTFCEEHGIVLARTLREFNAIISLLSSTSYRGGRRLGLFTASGGTAVLSADYAESRNLLMPPLESPARNEVAQHLGLPVERITNPLDTTGLTAFDMKRTESALASFTRGGFDLVLYPLGGAGGRNAAERIAMVSRLNLTSPVPIVPIWQHQRLIEEQAFHDLYASSMPVFFDYESPIDAMDLLAGRVEQTERQASVAAGVLADALDLTQVLAGLAASGVPIPDYLVLDQDDDTDAAFARLGSPLALKVSHAALLHKSDAGLVKFPILSAEQLRSESERMFRVSAGLGLTGARLVAQAGVQEGIELLCGFARDVEMGAYVVLAAGGIYAELLEDAAVVNWEPREGLERRIEAALRKLRIGPILAGARGKKAYDTSAVITVIARVFEHFEADRRARAMEVNPLIAMPEGALVVDARILV